MGKRKSPLRKTQTQVIAEFKEKHGDTYGYDKAVYTGTHNKVEIYCRVCKEYFWQECSSHRAGRGCQTCGRNRTANASLKTQPEVIHRFKLVHGSDYDYSAVEYVNAVHKVAIKCNRCHAVFKQTPNSHVKGTGCPICSVEKQKVAAAKTVAARVGFVSPKRLQQCDVIAAFRKKHGDTYDYNCVEYTSGITPVVIICKIHGPFEQLPALHRAGSGCPTCGSIRSGLANWLSPEQFLVKAHAVHGDRYTYDMASFVRSVHKMDIMCPAHGLFKQNASDHIEGKGCRSCAHMRSRGEREVLAWITSLGVECHSSDRSLIKPYELDIVCPHERVAIEYNGNRWHSMQFKADTRYHTKKSARVTDAGYRLISVRSDEWGNKKSVVQSILMHALGKTPRSVFARKCKIVTVTKVEFKYFADSNHIQGSCPTTSVIGLYNDAELVCCCAWVKRRDKWELVRFVVKNNTVVCGGFSRLVKAFGLEFHTFCERRLFGGAGYTTSGGVFQHTTPPDLSYTNGTIVMNRRRFQKKVAVKWMDTYDMLLTEKVNAENNGWYQLWGCGLDKYVFNA